MEKLRPEATTSHRGYVEEEPEARGDIALATVSSPWEEFQDTLQPAASPTCLTPVSPGGDVLWARGCTPRSFMHAWPPTLELWEKDHIGPTSQMRKGESRTEIPGLLSTLSEEAKQGLQSVSSVLTTESKACAV